jgi:hypothetical protein
MVVYADVENPGILPVDIHYSESRAQFGGIWSHILMKRSIKERGRQNVTISHTKSEAAGTDFTIVSSFHYSFPELQTNDCRKVRDRWI